MSRRPRPDFQWPSNGDPITLEVRPWFICRGYTAPPRRGQRTLDLWRPGERFQAICVVEGVDEYVTVLTPQGSFVNVWVLRNRRGRPVGINFAVQVFPERTADAEALPHDVPQNRLRSRSPRQRGGFAP